MSLQALIDDVVAQFGSLDRIIRWDDGVHELKACMQRHAATIYPLLQEQLTKAAAYLCQEGVSQGRAGMVDIGWHGNMQASIAAILKAVGKDPMIYGLYIGLWSGAQRNRPLTGWMEAALWNDYMPPDMGHGILNSVAILENTFSSNEGTTLGYVARNDGMRPLLADCEYSATQYESMLKPFQDAAVETITRLFSGECLYGITEANLTTDVAVAAVSRLGLSPTESEIEAFGSICHSADSAHASLMAIVPELSEGIEIGGQIPLCDSDWMTGSALTALRRSRSAEQRAALAADIRRQCHHYDSRTLSQFA
ncbi:hypothetical protein [Acetobacter fallax]|uniref:Uncharacterized protein n=1 Tax=Acetobacter fallax TaxID=1737473 RepID=A0ABX0KG22_9PROT|nr:hypothetical protein [Acetobacter fallax]NHO34154.1 hypothetical protein [Acetobacter fallax]NHO37703.1 hypothetical protein [Acetobacter fallax]